MSKAKKSIIEEFIALPDSAKDEIYNQIDAETPAEQLKRSRPLNARERAIWKKFQQKAGTAKTGSNAVRKVSISMNESLLKQADRYAKEHKLNRSELFAQGIQRLLQTA